MNKKWLVIDANYLCHRAKYVFGNLTNGPNATGVAFGFLKDILYYQEMFDTTNVVFCWDSKFSKRKEIYPQYKQQRIDAKEKYSIEEIESENNFRLQVRNLRKIYLKKMGRKNIFQQKGYESDDIIASVCYNLPEGDEAIIISSDYDLLQLISDKVSFYSPQKRKIMTLQGFKKKYGITPKQWIIVKTIAGCHTDNVKGIPRIGEITALRYVKDVSEGKTPKEKICQLIQNNYSLLKLNKSLVELPFKGTKVFQLKEDFVSKEGWKIVKKKLGIKSIG